MKILLTLGQCPISIWVNKNKYFYTLNNVYEGSQKITINLRAFVYLNNLVDSLYRGSIGLMVEFDRVNGIVGFEYTFI